MRPGRAVCRSLCVPTPIKDFAISVSLFRVIPKRGDMRLGGVPGLSIILAQTLVPVSKSRCVYGSFFSHFFRRLNMNKESLTLSPGRERESEKLVDVLAYLYTGGSISFAQQQRLFLCKMTVDFSKNVTASLKCHRHV